MLFKYLDFYKRNIFKNELNKFETIQKYLPKDINYQNATEIINNLLTNIFSDEIKQLSQDNPPYLNDRLSEEDFRISINSIQSDINILYSMYKKIYESIGQTNLIINNIILKTIENKIIELEKELLKINMLHTYTLNINNIYVKNYFDIINKNDTYKYLTKIPLTDITIDLNKYAFIDEKDNTIIVKPKNINNINFSYINYVNMETTKSDVNTTIDISKINNDGLNFYIYKEDILDNGAVFTLLLETRSVMPIKNILMEMYPNYQYSKIEIYASNMDPTNEAYQLIYTDTDVISTGIYYARFNETITKRLKIKLYQTTCTIDTLTIDDITKEYYKYNFNIKSIKSLNEEYEDYSYCIFKEDTVKKIHSITIIPEIETDNSSIIQFYLYKKDYDPFGNPINTSIIPLPIYNKEQVVEVLNFDSNNSATISFYPHTYKVYENNIEIDNYTINGNVITIDSYNSNAKYKIIYTPSYVVTNTTAEKVYFNDYIWYNNLGQVFFLNEINGREIAKSDISIIAFMYNNNFVNRTPKIDNIKVVVTLYKE